MNGKKGSIRIDICLPSNIVVPEAVKKPITEEVPSPRKWLRDVWEFARQDTNRVTFALKVGLACLLVSLLILFRASYDIFGTNIIWSIVTVAIMFEYTVAATLQNHGFSIFLIGAVTFFMKLWPSLVPYEYGFRVILLTYCLIIVSGYCMGNPIKTAMNRLYSIAMGGLVAVLVNAFIFQIWAGEQLHKELVSNFNSLADSLEECVKKYISDDGSKHPDFSKTVMDDFPDEPAFRKCRATLNSSEKLDSLANSAKWEPPHGRFKHLFYPWAEYVKVGNVLRHCAYEVMALHGCVHSEIQAPYNLKCAFRYEILDATNQAAGLLRSLAKDVKNMKWSLQTSLLKHVHISTKRLQHSIDLHYLFTANHEDGSSKAQLKTTRFLPFNLKDFNKESGEQESKVTRNTTTPSAPMQAESYHEMMKWQQRRLHSWLPREVDNFEDGENVVSDLIPRMCALESTTALSLATFTSLLIEFVARLDHLVEAVEKLATVARFKEQIMN
uniref:Aluminum-activated malate transporter n=1 Tax=Setaria viridis TaxID=4556 RepID=A0A4U6UDK7_SETVI|nr:hypothetical protein SEVIR_5G016200v2 [Setaria viridis]